MGIALLALGATTIDGIEEDFGYIILAFGMILLCDMIVGNIRKQGLRPPLIKKGDGSTWKISDFHDGEVRERFGFDSAKELNRLRKVLHWPQRLQVGKGNQSKRYHVDGEQALLYMLERDHCSTKLSLMEFMYGDSYNSICEQVLAAERWLVDHHGHRLRSIGRFSHRFQEYADAIKQRIIANGDAIPPEGHRLVGFVDRVSIRIAKPTGNWAFQRLFYSYKSKYHCLAYQSLYTPDGMHIDVYGPKAGNHNDRLLLGESNLNGLLEDSQRDNNGVLPLPHLLFGAYSDRGYDDDTCIRAAHHGPLTTALQIAYNNILSPVRVAVEWGFAKIRAISKLLHSPWNMKLQGEAVDLHVKAAVLLSNARTTLRGAQAVKYFKCVPPSLEWYFEYEE